MLPMRFPLRTIAPAPQFQQPRLRIEISAPTTRPNGIRAPVLTSPKGAMSFSPKFYGLRPATRMPGPFVGWRVRCLSVRHAPATTPMELYRELRSDFSACLTVAQDVFEPPPFCSLACFADFFVKPRSRDAPVKLCRPRRDMLHRRNFINREAAEEAQLYNADLARRNSG